MSRTIPTVTLSSGHAMPVLGLGTASDHIPSDLASTLLDAIEAGYRHFDTATLYGTEMHLGSAIAEALERGLVASRDEFFVTSKLWCMDAEPELVLPALKKSLKNLGLNYLDLYLIHWPIKMKKEEEPAFKTDNLLPIDIRATWEAMEQCHRLGLVKSIGVSNFSTKKLSQLLENATIPPAVNQVEMNVCWNQKKLREFCKEKGVHITAFSPLGGNGIYWGSMMVMESPVVKEIATAKRKSLVQVALRWLYEQGVCTVVKSYNKERMKENLGIFDWELDEDELKMIEDIPQRRGCPGDDLVSETGPYKTLEELWDGEI